MERYIGIDLGTTNSIVSVANKTYRGDIEAETLRVTQVDEFGLGIVEQESLPSVLYIEEGGTNYVGPYAKRMSSVYKNRVIKESKSYLGKSNKWKIDNKDYSPEIVASFFLDVMKKQVEKYYNGEMVNGAVITIPANFHFQQQQETRNAAVLAGFDADKIHMIPEPTAALIDFLNEEENKASEARRLRLETGPKKLLVFDLGGGTCDVSILQVQENANKGLSIVELSISQYTELGGRNFDQQVAQMLLNKYFVEKGLNAKLIQVEYGVDVFTSLIESFIDFAENAKKKFSSMVLASRMDYFENQVEFDNKRYMEMLPTHLPQGLISRLSITKKEYDDAIKSLLYAEFDTKNKNIEAPIRSALEEARQGAMSVDDIDAVFLVGGMTYYPTVQNRIYEIFNRRIKPLQSINPMISVSRGAAVFHCKLGGLGAIDISTAEPGKVGQPKPVGIDSLGIETTVPVNVFIDVAGNDPVPLLVKGTPLPFDREFRKKFYVSGTSNGISTITTMKLELFSASSATAIKTTRLQDAIIQFSKPVKAGSPLVLHVTCNEERDVAVRAWVEDAPDEMLTVNIGAKVYTDEEKQAIRGEHVKTVLEPSTY